MDYDHDLAMALHPDASKDIPSSPFAEVMNTLDQVTNQHKAQQQSPDLVP